MDYTGILRRSLTITWRHKWLWLLAFFAGESAGGSYSGRGFSAPSGGGGGGGRSGGAQPPDFGPALTWLGDHAALLVVIGVVLLLVAVVLFFISCIAVGALIRAAAMLDAGEVVGLGTAWGLGMRTLWPVVRLRLLLLAADLVLVIGYAGLIGLGILFAVWHAWGGVVLLVVWVVGFTALLVPVAIALPTWLRLTLRQIVLDASGAVEGLRGGLRLIFRRIGPVALLWLIEIGIGIGIGIAAVLVVLALILPGVALFGLGHAAGGIGAGVVLVVLLGVVAVVALIVFAAGLAAYFSVYWTLGYRRLRATS